MTISYHEYIRSYIVYFDPIMNKYLGIVFFLTLLNLHPAGFSQAFSITVVFLDGLLI